MAYVAEGGSTSTPSNASAPLIRRHVAALTSGLLRVPRRGTRILATTLLAIVVGSSMLVPALLTTSSHAAASTNGSTSGSGLWTVAADGGIFNYGSAGFFGSTGGLKLNKPVVAMAATPDGNGYWLAASDGGIFSFGDAGFYGSTGTMRLNKPVVALAATPDGAGYWLVASDGGIFSFGDAHFYGSTGGMRLNKSVVAMAPTPDGRGYWLVASDGGIFSYGDARFYGSTGALELNKPIVAMATTPDGRGYWLVASDGGIFSYGDATFYGSPNTVAAVASPIVAIAATPDGAGYWIVGSNGAVFPYGDAASYGSATGMTLNQPIVGADAASVLPASASQPITTTTSPPAAATTKAPSTTGRGPAPAPGTTTTTVPATTTTAPTTTTTTPVTPPAGAGGALGAPPGYSASQMIFDDQFSGTSLDTSKWDTYLGAEGQRWNNEGALPSPYSGPNTPLSDEGAMFGPSQVHVDNGLTLSATRNTNAYDSTYPWLSGVLTTGSKFTLPTSGWYVQVKAKMSDQSQGMWPAIWFLCGTSCPSDNEFDGYEGGWVGSAPNDLMHSDYFAPQGQVQAAYDVGTDVSAGYHVYGFRFLPGQSVTAYFDGRQVWQVNASSGVTIAGEPYEIILELQEATAQTSGWHTVTDATTPTASMQVAEVQAYS
jgi:glycosyl hydrolase family 16